MKKIIAPLLLSTLACAAQAATITVDSDSNTPQSGYCTLRDAIASVNDGSDFSGNCAASATDTLGIDDTIKFLLPPDSEIAVTGSHIEIQKDLIIDASSLNGDITLDANGSNRIFHVTDGDSLKITGVTFRNGNAGSDYGDNGGAIYIHYSLSSHTLTLEDCTFEDNQADNSGGAVAAITATISNSTFEGNSADSGGAVLASTATISNSTFEGNSADSGGAVLASTATISNSTFEGNSSIYNGGAVYAPFGTVNISNSTFKKNKVTNFFGGAVYAYFPATISNSTFKGNSAGYGGAVYTAFPVAISNSTFEGNSATSGGAVYAQTLDARHLTLLNNTAPSGSGQALYVLNHSTLHNSIIIGNDANDQCAIYGGGAAFTGSYNLEGYESSGNWQAAATTLTCGSSITDPPTTDTPLGSIIVTTLTNNSGPTKTLALPAGSPAIGAADLTGNTSQMLDDQGDWVDATLDQRGYGRAANPGNRSIGAYEYDGTQPTPPFTSGTPIPVLPAPLLLALAVAAGLLGRKRLNRNA